MRKYSFIVGAGETSAGVGIGYKIYQQMVTTASAYLIENFGGFTIYKGYGGSKRADGSFLFETTVTFMVLTTATPREIENAGKFLRDTFKQSEILVTEEETKVTTI